MSSLTAIGFTGNSLNGSLPDNICEHLPSIRGLYLSINQLSGHIPSKLWQCRQLLTLSMSVNNFYGRIPKDIGNLTQLTQIFLGSNNLTGMYKHILWHYHKLKIQKKINFLKTTLINYINIVGEQEQYQMRLVIFII